MPFGKHTATSPSKDDKFVRGMKQLSNRNQVNGSKDHRNGEILTSIRIIDQKKQIETKPSNFKEFEDIVDTVKNRHNNS